MNMWVVYGGVGALMIGVPISDFAVGGFCRRVQCLGGLGVKKPK
jgi:hypothetical protein